MSLTPAYCLETLSKTIQELEPSLTYLEQYPSLYYDDVGAEFLPSGFVNLSKGGYLVMRARGLKKQAEFCMNSNLITQTHQSDTENTADSYLERLKAIRIRAGGSSSGRRRKTRSSRKRRNPTRRRAETRRR
jgi:hypothetical protein